MAMVCKLGSPPKETGPEEDACFTLRFDDDVDIDVPCGQHQLMPDPDRCISFEPPQPKRECPLPGLPCSSLGAAGERSMSARQPDGKAPVTAQMPPGFVPAVRLCPLTNKKMVLPLWPWGGTN